MNVRVVILQDPAAERLELVPSDKVTLVEHLPIPVPVDRYGELDAHLAIVDLRGMRSGEIAPTLRELRAAAPDTRLIVVTESGDEAATHEALSAGAVAHVSRDVSPLALLRAVNSVARGGMHLGPTGKHAIRRLLTPTPDSKR